MTMDRDDLGAALVLLGFVLTLGGAVLLNPFIGLCVCGVELIIVGRRFLNG